MKPEELVLLSVLAAILLISQVSLAALPNVELVSLLVIIYTRYLKKRVFIIIYVFALLEAVLYGPGMWTVNYLYVWTVLAAVTMLLGKQDSPLVWGAVSGLFGLLFGLLCSLPYFAAGGAAAGVGYWLSGIPFDLLHCVSNFTVTAVLYQPVCRIMERLNIGKRL